MRRGLLDEMSSTIQQILFAGKFPVYCYMYTLRRFMRMNEVGQQDIEAFVRAVAGRQLSVREIDLLAEDILAAAIRCGKGSKTENSTGHSNISKTFPTTNKAATTSSGGC